MTRAIALLQASRPPLTRRQHESNEPVEGSGLDRCVVRIGRFVCLRRRRKPQPVRFIARPAPGVASGLGVGPEGHRVGSSVANEGRIDLGPRFGNFSDWPFADERQRAFRRERLDPVALGPPAAAATTISAGKDWPSRRCIRVMRDRKRESLVHVRRLPAIAQLDPQPEHARVELPTY